MRNCKAGWLWRIEVSFTHHGEILFTELINHNIPCPCLNRAWNYERRWWYANIRKFLSYWVWRALFENFEITCLIHEHSWSRSCDEFNPHSYSETFREESSKRRGESNSISYSDALILSFSERNVIKVRRHPKAIVVKFHTVWKVSLVETNNSVSVLAIVERVEES